MDKTTSIIENQNDFYIYTEEEQLTLVSKKTDNNIISIIIPMDTAKPVITQIKDGRKFQNKNVNELPIEILEELDAKGKLTVTDNNKEDNNKEDDGEV